MTIEFSVIPVLYLLGAAHGVFLAVALLTSKGGPRRANCYLGCYTLVFVCALFDYFLDDTGLVYQYVFARTLLWPKEFLYGVLIYFYTRELTQPGQFLITRRQWLHFVPAILHVLVTWPLLTMDSPFQLRILSGSPAGTPIEAIWSLLLGDVELILAVIHVSIYIVLSLRLILIHHRRLLKNYANLEHINLVWLRNLLIGTIIVYLCWLAEEFIDLDDPVATWLDATLGLSMVGLIYGMSLLGLRRSELVTKGASNLQLPMELVAQETPRESEQRYRSSAISEAMSLQLFEDLQQQMERHRLYGDNSLSLPKLAEIMGLSVNHLSQVINQQSGQNFFDYINRHRVADVQRSMRAGSSSTVLELAFDAGFNSKSAFYSAFRKYTGQTPTQFKKSM